MYRNLIERFELNLNSLKLYVESVEEALEIRQEFLKNNLNGIMFMEYSRIKFGKEGFLEGSTREELVELFETKIMKECKVKDEEINLTFINSKIGKGFMKSLEDLKLKLKQTNILYSGTLMLLVVYFEETISSILLKDLLNYPRIKIENTSLKFEEIKDLGSIEEAKKYIVEKEVEKIMKENPDEWVKYLKQKVKLKLKSYEKNEKYFNEIMARRNLIVHNDGVVNKYYLNRVGKDNIYNVNIGDVLTVDSTYILKAFEVFEEITITILFEIYLNDKINSDVVDNIFNIITNKYLFKDKYYIAEKLYKLMLDSDKVQGELRLFSQLNYWQSVKWQNSTNETVKKLEKEDYSVYKDNIYLGALALQEKYDEFFSVYNQQNEIGIEELSDWPIFRKVREDDRFKELIKVKEIVKEEVAVAEEGGEIIEDAQVVEIIEDVQVVERIEE